MKLKKTSEQVTRSYDEQGNMTARVDSANYSVIDDNGNNVGSASCYNGSANLNLNVSASTIDEGAQKLAEMLNATIEEGGEA